MSQSTIAREIASTAGTPVLSVRDALGDRHFSAEDFPLEFGGPGSLIVVAGRPEGAEVHIGMHEDRLFVQPAGAALVLHNGVQIQRSTWLRPGDVLNLGQARLRITSFPGGNTSGILIELDDGSTGNITAPPIITNKPRVSGDSGDDSEPIAPVSFRAGGPSAVRQRIRISPTRVVLSFVGLMVAAVLWFIFTAISVGIVSDPSAAQIKVVGALPAFPVGGRFLLRPGEYQVEATLPGYAPARLPINVTNEPNQSFALQLTKLPGKLRIELPVAAEVIIDGKPGGMSPGPFQLTPGPHTFQIAAQRYQPFSGDVEIEGADKTQVIAPTLIPAWGDVTLSSEPSGAIVRVDGEERGRTPLTTQVMAGNHPVELQLEGFKPWTTDLQVKANEPIEIGPVKLGLPDARLSVRSVPAGASVSVAGIYKGQTPLDLELRPDISYAVELSKPGYEAATRQLSLGSGESRSLSVSLEGVFGEVAVRAQPADAQILVDGKPSGAVNQTLRLVSTTHEIVIRKAGFVDYKTSVTPRPGLPQVIETTLLTAEQTRLAATPAVVRSKANQQLKLMPLGRFTMGSPRREPGRRANEAQREVEFKRAFYIGVKEVTNAEFKRYNPQHRSGITGSSTLELDNQPVVNVSWQDAAAYCNWLSEQENLPQAYRKDGDRLVAVSPMTIGYRLVTDAEWEWSARNAGNGKFLRYPWGDTLPVSPASGNYADKTANVLVPEVIPGYEDGYVVSAPVGKFPANPLGLFDMGGNVAEWAHDYYTVSVDGSQLAIDPMGPAEPPAGSKQHVVRGSSWRQSSVTDLRLSARDFSEAARNDLGFRIARYVE